jgi:hypothetical protein
VITPDSNGATEVPMIAEEAPLPPHHFRQLQDDELELTDLATKLAENSNYNLLIHTGWREPVERNAKLTPVYIDDNSNAHEFKATESSDGEQALSAEDELLASILREENQRDASAQGGSMDGQESSIDGPDLSLVHGLVTLKQSRFLHANIDMMYRGVEKPVRQEQTEQASPISLLFPMLGEKPTGETEKPPLDETLEELVQQQEMAPISGYRLQGSKRVRSPELMFFDHPLYGVLLQVRSYDPEEELKAITAESLKSE